MRQRRRGGGWYLVPRRQYGDAVSQHHGHCSVVRALKRARGYPGGPNAAQEVHCGYRSRACELCARAARGA